MNISKETLIANGGVASLAGADFAKLSPMEKANYNNKNSKALSKIMSNGLGKSAGTVTSIADKIVNRNELAKKMFGKKTVGRVDKDFIKQTKDGVKNKTYGFVKK